MPANGDEERLQRLAVVAGEQFQEPLQLEMARYAFLVLELPSLSVPVSQCTVVCLAIFVSE
jgi:hypothetical protein